MCILVCANKMAINLKQTFRTFTFRLRFAVCYSPKMKIATFGKRTDEKQKQQHKLKLINILLAYEVQTHTEQEIIHKIKPAKLKKMDRESVLKKKLISKFVSRCLLCFNLDSQKIGANHKNILCVSLILIFFIGILIRTFSI